MIKVKPRCAVGSDVLDFYREISEIKLNQISRTANQFGNRREAYLREQGADFSRLISIARDKGPGKGMDLELTRIRAVDLDRVEIRGSWLFAYTRELVIEETGTRKFHEDHINGFWDAGVYACCIPLTSFGTSRLDNIHFIPERAPNCNDRHPHHRAFLIAGSCNPFSFKTSWEEPVSPLKRQIHTCWSDFGALLSEGMDDANLPEVLKFLRLFLGRYNLGSPLRYPLMGDMDFMTFMEKI